MRINEERETSHDRRQVYRDRDTAGHTRHDRNLDTDEPQCPGQLVVVSNRQPYRHTYTEGDDETVADSESPDAAEIDVDCPTGGLTAGLDPVVSRSGGTWIAWGDGDADRAVTDDDGRVEVPPDDESYTLQRVWLSDEAVEGYYYGFSNRVLWPVCHEFTDLVEHRASDLEWYRRVNRRFADAVSEHATEESVVWLQDYHLALAPRMIRDAVPERTTIAQFWHIPWPRLEAFHACPNRKELLEGLLGNDLLGFHVDPYVETFLASVDRFVPSATVDYETQTVRHGGTETQVVATPMGVDAEACDRRSRSLDGSEWRSLRERYDIPSDVTLGLGVDRLDYTKGIPERLAAIERLLERNPGWREEFTFVQKATPSRTEIPAYERLGERVRHEVDRINARFATRSWQPIVYTEDYLSEEELSALYRRADTMVVSSLLDGMNLVAQEYVAASVDGDGTLVLSEWVGATERLGNDAYTIDPADTDAFAAAIDAALAAPAAERQRRMARLRRRVFDGDLESWMARQFDEIRRVRGPRSDHEGDRDERIRSRSNSEPADPRSRLYSQSV